jgi:alpha-glucosidase (family GH31 glycosyl hydrolase)
VLEPGATTRKLYLPRGRWIDFWRRRTVLRGPGEVTVPAPLGRLPLLVRAGAAIRLLPRRVETLAAYGKGNAVRLADVRARRTLLACRGRIRIVRGIRRCGRIRRVS